MPDTFSKERLDWLRNTAKIALDRMESGATSWQRKPYTEVLELIGAYRELLVDIKRIEDHGRRGIE